MTEINRRFAEPDPAERAKRFRSTKSNVLTLHGELKKIRDKLIDEKCSAYLNAQNNTIIKRKAADEDAKDQNRIKLQNHAKGLEAQKWLSEQKNTIEKEVARLKHIDKLEEAHRKANSRDLSIKKSALADVLISPAFIERFKNELKSLSASHINVELIKTRADHGRVYHKIRLVNCVNNVCTTDILSEGELRIVSLATFLADVEGHAHNTPFIFDDPISSLDQDFEEATVRRLMALCGSLQVIVFTHRLSLLSQLEEVAGKAGIKPHIVCIRREGQRLANQA